MITKVANERSFLSFNAAKNCGGITIGLLGSDGGELNKISDLSIIVPSKSTPRIQECEEQLVNNVFRANNFIMVFN